AFNARCSLYASWKVAAPFGQREPSLMGSSTFPSTFSNRPSRTWATVPHPTEQKGHTPITSFDRLILRSRTRGCACAFAGRALPLSRPAAATAVTPESLRKSRRFSCKGFCSTASSSFPVSLRTFLRRGATDPDFSGSFSIQQKRKQCNILRSASASGVHALPSYGNVHGQGFFPVDAHKSHPAVAAEPKFYGSFLRRLI